MMNRRRVILGGVGLAGVAGIGAWGLGHWGMEREIVSVLHRRLSFLKLDEEGVRAFAKDQTAATFNKKIPTWRRLRYHFLSAGAPSFQRFYRSSDQRSRVARLEDTLVSNYLLSSDFFANGADESRTINYVAYYDPMRACQNPFARPVVDPRAAS
jgi:hypothetical protein